MGKRRNKVARQKPDDCGIGPFPPEKELLTAPQTARVLKITTRGLSNWTRGKRPKLPSVKIGKSRRYIVADVLRLIEQFRVGKAT